MDISKRIAGDMYPFTYAQIDREYMRIWRLQGSATMGTFFADSQHVQRQKAVRKRWGDHPEEHVAMKARCRLEVA